MHLEMDTIVVETVSLLEAIDKMAREKRLYVILKDIIIVCRRQSVRERYNMDSIKLGNTISAGKDLCVPIDDAPSLQVGIDSLDMEGHSREPWCVVRADNLAPRGICEDRSELRSDVMRENIFLRGIMPNKAGHLHPLKTG